MLIYGLGYQKNDGFEQAISFKINTIKKEEKKNTKEEFFKKRIKMLKK
jgi:hypothetical protein